MNLDLILKVCFFIVLTGIGFKILKVFTTLIFKTALIVLVCLLVFKFFKLF